MSRIKHAVIACAGTGSRLGFNLPKCLVDMGDRKVIDYQLEMLKDVDHIRIVVRFMEHDVMEYVKRIRKDVCFCEESTFF